MAGPALAKTNRQITSPAVSITYDDSLASQLEHAVPALDEAGISATFYVTLDNMGASRDAWGTLPARGHELGNHTVTHPCDLGGRRVSEYAELELLPVESWLDRVCGPERFASFAYPCDVTNLGTGDANREARRFGAMLRRCGIRTARTSEGAPNNPSRLRASRYRLQALAVGYDAMTIKQVEDYLTMARRRGHWAILVVHGVGDGKKGSVSIEFHNELLRVVRASGLVVETVGTAFRRYTRDISPMGRRGD